ncbi:hypothetical protein BU16DRAFT_601590 [Lophium mytilinum]|uniref:Uncharacterized protein n=1 Tax=Lophium mytilinum TaxID=390894 RepID=A0A6A6R990_9PEZI|nr:hypothetical protein BU16DRAFT_601590 [Lophium mytilinum]
MLSISCRSFTQSVDTSQLGHPPQSSSLSELSPLTYKSYCPATQTPNSAGKQRIKHCRTPYKNFNEQKPPTYTSPFPTGSRTTTFRTPYLQQHYRPLPPTTTHPHLPNHERLRPHRRPPLRRPRPQPHHRQPKEILLLQNPQTQPASPTPHRHPLLPTLLPRLPEMRLGPRSPPAPRRPRRPAHARPHQARVLRRGAGVAEAAAAAPRVSEARLEVGVSGECVGAAERGGERGGKGVEGAGGVS